MSLAVPVLVTVASIAVGARALSVGEVWHGLFQDSGTYADVVAADRLSRTALGLPAGADLVGRGRCPHQGIPRQWSTEDERVVQESMAETGAAELAERYVDELSGGQRQRVWIARALARQTPLPLPDEPTTFPDIQHRTDVLDLCAELHEERGRTLVAVPHDLNHSARYATHLIALKDSKVITEGAPGDIVTAALVAEVFGTRRQVIDDPETGTPPVVPAARTARAKARPGMAKVAATEAS